MKLHPRPRQLNVDDLALFAGFGRKLVRPLDFSDLLVGNAPRIGEGGR
jgi:hypothetical protein